MRAKGTACLACALLVLGAGSAAQAGVFYQFEYEIETDPAAGYVYPGGGSGASVQPFPLQKGDVITASLWWEPFNWYGGFAPQYRYNTPLGSGVFYDLGTIDLSFNLPGFGPTQAYVSSLNFQGPGATEVRFSTIGNVAFGPYFTDFDDTVLTFNCASGFEAVPMHLPTSLECPVGDPTGSLRWGTTFFTDTLNNRTIRYDSVFTAQMRNFRVVPEPSALALFAAGLGLVVMRRRFAHGPPSRP